ncbi:hypothetical protein BOX15_Mlig024065g1 [Macrostomum lignano]|uniref:PSI domain-containing protein n=1 Tax=Macrostomum lignano TaxID=282301 RepID=A0A267EBI1_9PLAT|nr:hypothetical protein BOX15_Mlig024065g1 [Macrostomum lignano]
MTISTILWTIGTFVLVLLHSAVGLSEINPTQVIKDEGEVFEFESANKPVTSTIRLLDRPTLEHGIVRRDTSDSGEPDLSEDNHVYYNMIIAKSHPMSTYYSGEFDRIFSAYSIRSNINLNNGKNLALTIPLVFSFDFYGHSVKSIVLTTSGFIYVNDLTHPYLTFSQYIAPMMADFETRRSVSAIKYVEAEDAFWVRWENLFVSSNYSLGTFSFQCAILSNGSIVFDYIKIPITMEALRSASSMLKIGLSDAFYYEVKAPGLGTVLRKIVRYHELRVPRDQIVTDGIIHLVHQPTCNQQTSCSNCTDRSRVPAFNCSWCYDLGRCSSGVDRRLQDWHDSECHYSAGGTCGDGDRSIVPLGRTGTKQPPEAASRRSAGQVALGVCLGILALAAVATVAGVLLYGFRHPGSRLGAWLIEHRPSRYRERFFGASGGGASGTGGASESYKVSSENAYVNFSNT